MNNLTLAGHNLSPGLGMGTAYTYHDVVERVESVYCLTRQEEVERECQRLEEAIGKVVTDLESSEEEVGRILDEDFAQIFRAHRQVLKEPSLLEEMRGTIQRNRVNAECVVSAVFRRLETQLRHHSNARSADRADDVGDLARRVLQALAGQVAHELETLPPDLEGLPPETIVVARRLLPSDTVYFSRQSVAGLVLEDGGSASHAAILTRELGIPAVSGIVNAIQRVPEGRTVLVDGTEGMVVVEPDEGVRQEFRKRQVRVNVRHAQAREASWKQARTRDGTEVSVLANISCREDAVLARENGADGVGLCRIEQLYFGQDRLPGEQELVERLQDILEPIDTELIITLRLPDTGGDKPLSFLRPPSEPAPLLGRRGVRFLLDYPELLMTQLRSFLRLSKERKVRILVPMVTLPSDMLAVREIYGRVTAELSCTQPPPLGSMIETPAAAICADSIVQVSDFLSAGTNDLTQYTMAAGRENSYVTEYFSQSHPAIFRLLAGMIRAAGDKPTSLCGELAGDLESLPALLEIGFRELSVNSLQIPRVKEEIGTVDLSADELHRGDSRSAWSSAIGNRRNPRAPPCTPAGTMHSRRAQDRPRRGQRGRVVRDYGHIPSSRP